MTPTSPTWGDIEQFLNADGWTELRPRGRGGARQKHIFFEKVLADERVLQTRISHDRSGVVSAGRFSEILRRQLDVNRQEFWEAVRTRNPVSRPVPTDPAEAVELPARMMKVLVGDLHLSADQIAELDPQAAEQLVQGFWARPT